MRKAGSPSSPPAAGSPESTRASNGKSPTPSSPFSGTGTAKCNVIVTVRVRPILNRREEDEGESATCLSVEDAKSITIFDPDRSKKDKKRTFAFDYVYNSLSDPSSPKYHSQEAIFNDIGLITLAQAFQGYNTCIFAYGQTSSGKTYTMMGQEGVSMVDCAKNGMSKEVGLIPRICVELFKRISEMRDEDHATSFRVEASYYEIYNEKVHDLLDTKGQEQAYRVREHPRRGPYVEGLAKYEVKSYSEIERLLKRGAKIRHTASTLMNDHSSRSHAVCSIILTSNKFDPQDGDLQETVSRMELVDLAGSERSSVAGTQGQRLVEGSNINKSLLTLGNVIEALAARSDKKSKDRNKFVQYRDSTLTWLLREALGGNSKTIMVATLSPSALNYEESLSTLKYADRAKKIQNMAHINRDSKKAIIMHLREEIGLLRAELEKYRMGVHPGDTTAEDEDDEDTLSKAAEDWFVRITKGELYLLQVKPPPALQDIVLYWVPKGTTYVSCEDHTGPGVDYNKATSSSPLDRAEHTIVLQRSKGVERFHALMYRDGDSLFLHSTRGSPYTGGSKVSTRSIQSDNSSEATEVLIDGMPVEAGGERLTCGARISIGEYDFIYCDPENVDELVAFQRECSRYERAKAARDKGIQVMSKKVQRILSDGGVQPVELPGEDVLDKPGSYDGETQIIRGESGPVVYVWRGEQDQWEPADTFQAEMAAYQTVDRKKADEEISRRLTSVVMGNVELNNLPTTEEVLKTKGKKGVPLLVRSPRHGLQVLQWDEEGQCWERASEAVAEMAAKSLVEEKRVEKKKRDGERVAEQQVAEESEAKDREIADLRARVESLSEQLHRKDKLLQEHKQSASEELRRQQMKHEQSIDELERRVFDLQHIQAVLENNLKEAEYQAKTSENMHDLCLSAKEKAIAKMVALQAELAALETENREVRLDMTQLQQTNEQITSELREMEQRVAEADKLRSSCGSDAIQALEEKVSTLQKALRASDEARTQAQDNLRRLSQQYVNLRQELVERESRLGDYRGILEDREAEVHQLEVRRAEAQAMADQLASKLQAAQEECKLMARRQQEREVPQQKALQALQKRLQVLETELEQQQHRGLFGDRRNTELTNQKAHLQKQLKDTLEKYNSTKRQLEEARAAQEESRANEKTLRDEIASLQNQVRVYRQRAGPEEKQEHMQLSIQLELAQQENEKLKSDLRAHRAFTKEMVEGGQTKLKDELANTKSELASLEKRCGTLERRLDDAKSRAEREKTARERKEEEIQYLKQELVHARTHGSPPEKHDMGRRTNPFGPPLTTPNPAEKKTPRDRRVFTSRESTPSYMKQTANWKTRTDDLGSSTENLSSSVKSNEPVRRSNSKGRVGKDSLLEKKLPSKTPPNSARGK